MKNPDGTKAIGTSHLQREMRAWVEALERLDGPQRDRAGQPVPFPRERVVPYSFRHSFAQRHADSGTPIEVLAELMGHSRLTTTQGYFRVTGKRKRKAVDTLAALQVDRDARRTRPVVERLLDAEAARDAIGQVAVPFGICTEPTNVKAHGQACPFRHQCFGCTYFRIRSACCTRLCCQCEGRVWWTSGSCSGSVAALRRKPRPAMRRLGGRVLLTVSAGWGSGSGSRS